VELSRRWSFINSNRRIRGKPELVLSCLKIKH